MTTATTQERRTTGLILAAGAGTRLGRGPKALLPFRGRPLVEAVAAALLDGGCRDVVVVLGAGAAQVVAAAKLDGCQVVTNPDWESGMGSSFLLGLATADPADDVMVALVDQPGLTSETVRRLLDAHRPGRVTAAAYRRADSGDVGPAAPVGSVTPAGSATPGRAATPHRGHPLLIDSSLRAAVAETVTGDAGARGFLRSHPELVDEVDCSDQSTGEDIDTPDQLRLLE